MSLPQIPRRQGFFPWQQAFWGKESSAPPVRGYTLTILSLGAFVLLRRLQMQSQSSCARCSIKHG